MSSGSGVKKDAFANAGTADALSSNLAGNAGNLYGTLAPQLTTEATNPQGYGPTTLAKMNTAAQQSAGGSQAAATGQGALLASRTKNAGTADAAIAQSAKTAGQNLSQDALQTQLADANLKQKQQQAGLSGEQNLYNTELGGSMNALGLSNNALGVANNAKPGFWQQFASEAGNDVLGALTGNGGSNANYGKSGYYGAMFGG